MIADRGRLLLVDDERSMCELLAVALEHDGHKVTWTLTAREASDKLGASDFDVVLCDVQLGEESGLELCAEVVARRPDLPVVVITAFGNMDVAVEAIRAGAYDFLHKPVDMRQLKLTVGRAVEHRRLRAELRRLKSSEGHSFDELLGESRSMKSAFEMIARVAPSDAPVLVRGESGTGKELVARALHARSAYKHGPLVPVNCAAIPATLFESTLFGHVKGAFTDARSSQKGIFLEADGGTLFFDEIGEIPLEMQAKLLRVLQERRVRPVGGNEELPFDARIVSATNRDLEQDVAKGLFREDLYYRINVVTIDMPPLRSRGNDVLVLAQHFLERMAERAGKPITGFAPEVARMLLQYDWPGNVRELMNVMERAVALARFDGITVEDLPEKVSQFEGDRLVIQDNEPDFMLSLDDLEKRYITRVLRATGDNKTRAAEILGIDRRTLHRKLAKWNGAD